MQEKFALQEGQYVFPYHYIPYFAAADTPRLSRRLSWGLEYLCYQHHIRDQVVAMYPRSVLEVGCGDGHFLGLLPNQIANRTGVDLAERAIAFARAFHPGCRFLTGDVGELDEVFDVVAAIEVLEHIPDDAVPGFLRAIADRLSPEGRLVLCVPTDVVPRHRKHYRHYSEDLLRQQLSDADTGLQIERIEFLYREPWWGRLFASLTGNGHVAVESRFLLKWAWRQVWHRYRIATAKDGRHLMAVLVRPAQARGATF